MTLKFIAKLILNGVILTLMLYWYTEITIQLAFFVSILFAIVAWLLGDQLILRASNNMTATIADFGLTVVYLWIVREVLDISLDWGEIFVISAIVGVAEWAYHRYVLKPGTVMNGWGAR